MHLASERLFKDLSALIFVAIGLWIIISPPAIENSYWGNPTKIDIAVYAFIIFFGLCFFFFIRKLGGGKPRLIIDDLGLVGNSSGLSAGHILWSDIENISVIEIHRQKFIMLQVKNLQHYIDIESSVLKCKVM